MNRLVFLAGTALALVSQSASAQDAATDGQAAAAPAADSAPPAEAAAKDAPKTAEKAIIITGKRRRDDVLGDVSVLSGDALARDIRPTIGETLIKQPGVSAAGSGPNVAKPVLRGLSGDRIRILTDGIGSLDVSASSSDHAVAINPLTAQSIEILHGPAALVFGSSAIGGVVNVVDSRIPRRVPEAPLGLKGIAGYGTAANEWIVSGAIDVPLAANFVAHLDASRTRNDDLETGGYILAKPLRRQAALSGDPA
uniref:TonB-dependent receptor plug domain-containing protein n=1 Tax=Sphingomonas sp. TaxID=28214 RepID=UPI00286B7820